MCALAVSALSLSLTTLFRAEETPGAPVTQNNARNAHGVVDVRRKSVCVHYDKRTGAATRESLRRDRHVGITSPALLLATGPVFFTQTVVIEAKTRTSTMPNMHQTIKASTSNKRTCTHNQNAVASTVQACRHASEYKNILCVIPIIANTKTFSRHVYKT